MFQNIDIFIENLHNFSKFSIKVPIVLDNPGTIVIVSSYNNNKKINCIDHFLV